MHRVCAKNFKLGLLSENHTYLCVYSTVASAADQSILKNYAKANEIKSLLTRLQIL